MGLAKHPRQLLVIITEASIEGRLVADARRLGAQGYTVSDVRGAGAHGAREGSWEADRTVRIEVVCEGEVADAIAAHVLAAYASHYRVTLYFSQVQVLRPQKF